LWCGSCGVVGRVVRDGALQHVIIVTANYLFQSSSTHCPATADTSARLNQNRFTSHSEPQIWVGGAGLIFSQPQNRPTVHWHGHQNRRKRGKWAETTQPPPPPPFDPARSHSCCHLLPDSPSQPIDRLSGPVRPTQRPINPNPTHRPLALLAQIAEWQAKGQPTNRRRHPHPR
jgi:hypothetical protein